MEVDDSSNNENNQPPQNDAQPEEQKEEEIGQEGNEHNDEESQEEEIPNELLNEKLDQIMNRLNQLDIDKEIGAKKGKRETRVVIDKIELTNFKSYSGRQKAGPLHIGFNAIVGPNGSGKSNLMESMLFAFGKRAKKMRLNKLSELIHNSAANPNCRSAKVQFFFREIKDEGDGKYTYIEGGDFSISREVFKNSSSKYYYNDEDITYDELAKTLAQKEIDLKHNRFLILQGEVELIALMKPKAVNPNETGLLEFLEDIIGTSRYVSLIENLGKSIDELREIKRSKMNRVRVSANELDQLEDIKNTSIDFYNTEKHLIITNNLVNVIKMEHTNNQQKEKEDRLREIKETEDNLIAEMNAKRDESSSLILEYKKIKLEEAEIEKEKKRLEKKMEEYDEQDRKKRDEIEMNMKQIKKLNTALERLNKNYNTQNEKILNAKNETPKLKAQLELFKKEFQKLDQEIVTREKEIFAKTEPIQKRKLEIENLLQPSENEINSNNFKIKQNEDTIELLNNSLKVVVDKFKENEGKKEIAEGEFNKLKEKLNELLAKKEDIEKDLNDEEENAISKKRETEEKYKELQGLLTRLSEAKNNNNDRSDKDKIVNSLLKAQEEGKLKGILGRLGNLGTIDEKYDIAISTACGFLENIVVEKVEDAQRGIEFLRENRLGKTTFMVLDKINWVEKNLQSRFQCPNGCQRLYDLVKKNEPRLNNAFYYALRDTLVAPDIPTARQVAFGRTRYRVVTLNGELFEVYGTISGGGRPKRGGMSNVKRNVSSEQDYQKLNDDYNKCVKEYEILKVELSKSEGLFLKLKNSLSDVNLAIDKLETDMTNVEKAIKVIQDLLDKSVKELQKNKKEQNTLDELKRENNRIELINKKIIEESQEHRKELEEIDKKLADIMGEDFNKKKEEHNQYFKQIKEIEATVNQNEELLQNASDTLERVSKEIELKEKAKEDSNKIIEQNQKFLEELETKAMELMGEVEKCDKTKEDIVEQFNKNNKEVEEIKKKIHVIKEKREKLATEKIDIDQEIIKITEIKSKIQEDLNYNKRDFEKLISDFGFVDEISDEIKKINGEKPDDKDKKSKKKQNDNSDKKPDESSDKMDIDDDCNIIGNSQEPKEEHKEEENKESDEEEEIIASSKKSKKMKKSTVQKILEKYYAEKKLREVFTDEEIKELFEKEKEIMYEHTNIGTKLNSMKPNMNAITQYKNSLLKLKERQEDLNQTEQKLSKATDIYDGVKKRRYNEFIDGYTIINDKLKEMYQKITTGGDAELELVDTSDPFIDGISFNVRPVKKGWKSISILSGGEKTLASLALIFALHHYKPSPFYVMDEIDAALDFKNVSIIGEYIKNQTRDAQFLVISLRNHMYEFSERMVGIYKTYDMTKCIIFFPESVELPKKNKNEDGKKKLPAPQKKIDQ